MDFITECPTGLRATICYPTTRRKRFFAYRKHGGIKGATKKAEAFIRSTLTAFPRHPYRMKTKAHKNSQSGVRGVSPGHHKKNGRYYRYWAATYKRNGR